ncbi:MAG: tetratricopeptide repeat protein [bacterium]
MSFSTSDSNLEIAPPSALELLWINHRGSVIAAISGVVVIAIVILSIIASTHSARIASASLLSEATDDAALKGVISKYPHSPAAANAMLLLAASLRDAGKIDASNELYSEFAESFPNSSLVVSGLLGRASNARVSNHLDQALSSYQQAAAAFPQSYGAPFALFSQVQLLAQAGKPDDAKKVLQSLLTQYPGSAAAQAFGGASSASQPAEQ